MTPLEILRAARAKIATEETWTRSMAARDATGREVSPRDPMATHWCASGAVLSLGADHLDRWDALRAMRAYEDIETVNDRDGHAAVLALFDAAIARLEAAGG